MNKGFTLIETALLMLVTAILLSAGLTISNFSKSFLRFQEEKFLLADNLKKAQDLSFRSLEINFNGATSTICGVGLLIYQAGYKVIAYATSPPSTQEIIDCYKIASNTPEEFDFTQKKPSIFYTKTNEFTTDKNNQFIISKELKDFNISFKLDNKAFSFVTTSIIFTHPYGELIIYQNGNQIVTQSTPFKNFYILLNKGNEYATITITNTGQIISQ
jgi:type II secretory pathway pseudopilin PulG